MLSLEADHPVLKQHSRSPGGVGKAGLGHWLNCRSEYLRGCLIIFEAIYVPHPSGCLHQYPCSRARCFLCLHSMITGFYEQ